MGECHFADDGGVVGNDLAVGHLFIDCHGVLDVSGGSTWLEVLSDDDEWTLIGSRATDREAAAIVVGGLSASQGDIVVHHRAGSAAR